MNSGRSAWMIMATDLVFKTMLRSVTAAMMNSKELGHISTSRRGRGV